MNPDDIETLEQARAEIKRLRERNHEIQETADKKVANLRHRLENIQLFLEVSNGWYREGGNWFWDEAKIAARPLMLSINHAEAYGVLVSQRNAATQDVVRLRKALDSQSATLKKLYDELKDMDQKGLARARNMIWRAAVEPTECFYKARGRDWRDIEIERLEFEVARLSHAIAEIRRMDQARRDREGK